MYGPYSLPNIIANLTNRVATAAPHDVPLVQGWTFARIKRTHHDAGSLAFNRHDLTLADPISLGAHVRAYSFHLGCPVLVPVSMVELVRESR